MKESAVNIFRILNWRWKEDILTKSFLYFHKIHIVTWAGYLSRYSDWLRAGRSGDRIAVGSRFSALVQNDPGAHPASCRMGIGSFPGVNSGRGVTLTPHSLLVPWSRKSRAITLLPPMGRTTRTDPQCLYKCELYLYLTEFLPGGRPMLEMDTAKLLWKPVNIYKQRGIIM